MSGEWSVVSGPRMLSPPLDTGGCSGPGEAGEGVRGKRGGHGEEEEDGETVRLWRGCWRLDGALQNAWLQKQVLLASGSGPAAEETLATSSLAAAARRCTVQLQHVCRPALLTAAPAASIRTPCAEYPRHEVLRAAAASLSGSYSTTPPGRCPLCLLGTSCFYIF